MRLPPALMATQHPDAPVAISVEEEVDEAVEDLAPPRLGGLGCDEKMLDYEGKLTPFLQPVWIVERLSKLELEGAPLLTIRVPDARAEGMERHVLALLATAVAFARSPRPMVKYVIYPLADDVEPLVATQRRLLKLISFAREELGAKHDEMVRIIPLLEDPLALLSSRRLVGAFVARCERQLGVLYDSVRVLLGKSDTAVACGHLASALIIRLALYELSELERERGIRAYPIVGAGPPPFRGHLSPENAGEFARAYAGYFTVTVQTSFRRCWPRDEVLRALALLREARGRPPDPVDRDLVREALVPLAEEYVKTLLMLVDAMLPVADMIPRTRERMARERYGRSLEASLPLLRDPGLRDAALKASRLPRAIRMVAAFYTMGIPPEIIGLGHGLSRLGEHADAVLKAYPMIVKDLEKAARFACPEVACAYLGPRARERLYAELRLLKELLDFEPAPADEYVSLLRKAREKLGDEREFGRLALLAGEARRFLG